MRTVFKLYTAFFLGVIQVTSASDRHGYDSVGGLLPNIFSPRKDRPSRDLQVLAEDSDCKCLSEDGITCMIPVCPQGFYKCCFDCKVSTCAKEALGYWPDGKLTLSERGVMECLQCRPGDFCPGCDKFEECPIEAQLFTKSTTPKISAPGAFHQKECQRCPDGFEADLDRDRCVPKFRGACDIKLLEICMLGCKENPTNNECEKMACKLYCAKDQERTNPECVAAFTDQCIEMNTPRDDTDSLVLTTTPSPTMLLSDDSGMATVEPIQLDKACQLNCSSAMGKSLSVLVFGFAFLLYNF